MKEDLDSYNQQSNEVTLVHAKKGENYTDVNALLRDKKRGVYVFCNTMHYGDDDNSYIYAYPAEQLSNYLNRRDLSDKKKISSEIVNSYYKKTFSDEPVRVFKSKPGEVIAEGEEYERVKKFIDSCGIDGQSLTKVVEDCTEAAFINSITFSIVDNLPQKDIPKLNVDSKDVKPWVYLQSIINVDKYKLNHMKQLEEISFFEECRKIKIGDKETEDKDVYRFWGQTQTYFYYYNDKKPVKIPGSERKIPFFPVVMHLLEPRKDVNSIYPKPKFKDVYFTEFVINNKQSDADNNQRMANFPILTAPDIGDFIKSVSSYINLPSNTKIKPEYITPDPETFRVSMQSIKESMEDLMVSHNMDQGVGVQTKSSGVAIKFELNEKDIKIKPSSKIAKGIDESIIERYYRYIPGDLGYDSEYKSNHAPDNVEEKLEMLRVILVEMSVGEEFRKFLIPHLIKLVSADVDPVLIEKITTDEIATYQKRMDSEQLISSNSNQVLEEEEEKDEKKKE